MELTPWEQALAAHDAALRAAGLDIWLGAEPTFTDRFSEDPQWLFGALGAEKQQRAEKLARQLVEEDASASVLLRTVGRQYPDEPAPRWSLGLYARRDGQPLWNGPPDPLLLDGPMGTAPSREFKSVLPEAFRAEQLPTRIIADETPGVLLRLLFSEADVALPTTADDPRWRRPSLHDHPVPASGCVDALAAEGVFLLSVFLLSTPRGDVVGVELPSLQTEARFERVLKALATAANKVALPALILRGFPPPNSPSTIWTTLTPDPAVLEINSAPASSLVRFAEDLTGIYHHAEQAGLASYRAHYNGDVVDSGGGGQLTFGGPTPDQSPFFVYPHLLPSLITYSNHHPALSYLFAHDYVGGSGQSVRPDESGWEHLAELKLALAILRGERQPSGETIWRALAPFLTDTVGNSHRAEWNIEKLANPYLPGRGCLGLVEFRASRMAVRPESYIALAALLRSILARLAVEPFTLPLQAWGRILHERFALPFYLRQDLHEVLADLRRMGFGLPEALAAELVDEEARILRRAAILNERCCVTIRRAVEFWPLVGDTASQERGTARLIDASTIRLELRLQMLHDTPESFRQWHAAAGGFLLPLRFEADETGPLAVYGLRYRRFIPGLGLHPTLGTQTPRVILWHPGYAEAVEVTCHEWYPAGGAYDGLPVTLAEAQRRRQERVVLRSVPVPPLYQDARSPALTDYHVDFRWLAITKGAL